MKINKSAKLIGILCIAISSIVAAETPKVVVIEENLQVALTQQLHNGRWELVMFWATYCHICKKDFRKLGNFIEEHSSLPLTIVGIVIDGLDEQTKTRNLVDEHQLNYIHLATNYDLANKLFTKIVGSQLIGTPSYLLYDTNNQLVAFNHNAIDLDALETMVYQ